MEVNHLVLPPPAVAPPAAALTCELCGSAVAGSRNALFRHVAKCRAMAESAAQGALMQDTRQYLASSSSDPTRADVFLYAIGGRCRGRTLGSCERFSFKTGEWTMCQYLSQQRGSHCAAAVRSDSGDTTLYCLGGGGFRSNLATCEKLLISAPTPSSQLPRQWEQISPMTTYRHALVCVLLELPSPRIVCLGGWVDGSRNSPDVESYDCRADKWQTCAPMHLARRLLGAAGRCTEAIPLGEIFVFGGQVQNMEIDMGNQQHDWFTETAERYDVAADTWSPVRALPESGPCSAAAVGAFIFVFMHGKRVLRFCPASNSYLSLSNLPLREWFCFDVCKLGPVVYLVGGKVRGDFSKACWAYDTRTDAWEKLPDMLRQRRRCAVDVVVVT